MPLSPPRVHQGRPTHYPWERQALDQIYAKISDNDPHQAWELHELYDSSSGRLYEIDLAFLSRVGLMLVEIKSHFGVLEGDIVDWTFTNEEGRKQTIECPYPGANLKARVLASLLERQPWKPRPFVQAVVFLPNVTRVALEGGKPPWLLTGDDLGKLVNGLGDREPKVIVNRPMMKEVVRLAERIGLRPSRTARIIGGYAVGELVDDGEGYQEHLARSEAVQSDQVRVRTYLVPAATSLDRRAMLGRAARREAQVLAQLGQHPGILSYRTFVEDSPLGPAVVFEAFEGGLPLHAFVKQHPDLTFDERLGILQQLVEAVTHCHRAGVLHRNLAPGSVLVRRDPAGKLQVRIHRFQTAAWVEHSSFGTRHFNDLAHATDRLYQAPEVLADPDKATYDSDVFSVGCLAWLLFTGQHPAATLAERELRLGSPQDSSSGLKPSSVRSDLADLDVAIAYATHPNLHSRAGDAFGWFEAFVLDPLTRPTAEAATVIDPRDARKGDELPGGLRVERRLGKGGTAVVLQVRRKDRDYALKVPHDEGCGERLVAEARALGRLHHEHIVELSEKEALTINKLPCLLLQFAGEKTLGDRLREEGTLPLELARRYGDDLLSAVQYLEEQGLTHRDIKPTNIGFTSVAKKQAHLLLLDFSLSSAPATAVSAGTPEWRDPWLYLRGSWDTAADLWSSGAVLYQALTGARPEVALEGPQTGEIRIEAERLDAAVRDRLAAFFRRALARDPAARYATAETMRQAWVEALAVGGAEEAVPEVDLAQVRPQTPVDALALSARARNALDRAGVRTVAELLQLPRNQLSVIRGVGTRVAREIYERAEELRPIISLEAGAPLLAGFVRPRLALDDSELGLELKAREALGAAGLTSSIDLAQAEGSRIERLVGEAAAQALRGRLEALAAAEPAPGSLGEWVRALIGRPSETEASRRVRVLVGLDPFPDGRPEVGPPGARSVPEVAGSLGLEPAQLHSSLQFLRTKRWLEAPATGALTDCVTALLDAHGPAVSLGELAGALASLRSSEAPTEVDRTNAVALVRVALELRPDPPAHWRRIADSAWIAREAIVLDAVAALGTEADKLAAGDPLPSSEAVRAALLEAVEGSPLAELPADRRIALAARASRSAAASARLELYPRGMAAARALQLSPGALTGAGLTAEVIRKRISARYPEAMALPERPELDALLAVHGLTFNPEVGAGEYLRPGQSHLTSSTVQQPTRPSTAPPGRPAARASPDEQRAAAFQDQLERGVAASRFRVIQVQADRAASATEALARSLRTEAVSFDHALVEALRLKAQQLGVEWGNVEAADRAGPEGPDWSRLLELVRQATDALLDRLLATTRPLLLAWPGAFARYGLAGALSRLSERAQRGDTPAVVLVVPSHVDGLAPSINGRMPVPAPEPGQRMVMPEAWLARNAAREVELS